MNDRYRLTAMELVAVLSLLDSAGTEEGCSGLRKLVQWHLDSLHGHSGEPPELPELDLEPRTERFLRE